MQHWQLAYQVVVANLRSMYAVFTGAFASHRGFAVRPQWLSRHEFWRVRACVFSTGSITLSKLVFEGLSCAVMRCLSETLFTGEACVGAGGTQVETRK